MRITYDARKNAANITKHGVAFDEAYAFDFIGCHTIIDARHDYGEIRYLSTGLLGDRLHVLCYVETESGIRAISFRKANDVERKKYVQAKTI